MNWERSKTILIVMFLTVDVFLLVILLQTRLASTRLKDSVISETIAVLREHDISVEKELIPPKRAVNQNIIMRNYFEEPEKIATFMLKKYKTVQADTAVHEYLYQGEGESLYVKGTSFTYNYNKSSADLFENEMQLEKSKKTLRKQALENLSRLGFDKKTMFICEDELLDGLYHCKVIPLYNEKKVYGIAMQAVMDRETVLSLEGAWFKAASAEKNEQEKLLDVTAVLAGFIFNKATANTKITQIENAFYVANSYLENREIAALPIYAIQSESASGEKALAFFDARSGTPVQEQAEQKEAEEVTETEEVAEAEEVKIAEETIEQPIKNEAGTTQEMQPTETQAEAEQNPLQPAA